MNQNLNPAEGPRPDRFWLTRPIVHAVMYRDYQLGTLCNSGAWGPPMLFSAITEKVTCPGCREKLDGTPPPPATDPPVPTADEVEALAACERLITSHAKPTREEDTLADGVRRVMRTMVNAANVPTDPDFDRGYSSAVAGFVRGLEPLLAREDG